MGQESLYGVVAEAETGSFKNPWIRTTFAPKGGSSAFGPVQVTKTKAEDYAERGLVSKQSADFIKNVMTPLYDQFLKYGKESKKAGYMPEYDYGGTGFFPEQHKQSYESMAKEMMLADYVTSGGDPDAFIKLWRGTNKDKRWNKIVKGWFEKNRSK